MQGNRPAVVEDIPVPTPEALARIDIDEALAAVGWHVKDVKAINLHAARDITRKHPKTLGSLQRIE